MSPFERALTAMLLVAASMLFATAQPAFAQALSPPVLTPSTGIFNSNATVSMTGPTGATIHYTLDGTQPDQYSPIYGPSILLTATTTIKAIAIETGHANSSVTTAYYKIDPNMGLVQTTNLLLWLQSDPNFITSSSGAVSSWLDLSASSSTATQTTGTKQPTLVSNDWNGFSSVTTASSKFLNLPTGFSSFAGCSIFAVIKPTNTSNGDLIDLGNGAASNNITVATSGTTGKFTIYNGSTSSSISSATALTLGQYQLLEAIQTNSSTGSLSTNGVQDTTGTLSNPNSVSRTVNHIATDNTGAANFFTGGIVELLCYSVPLSAVAKQQLEQYLMQKYQLSFTTPTAPVMSVAGGTLTAPVQVAIAGRGYAVTHLTVDGSTPTAASPVYSAPISVSYTTTIKAISVLNGLSSSVTSNTYNLDSTHYPAPSGTDTRPLQIYTNTPAVAPAPY